MNVDETMQQTEVWHDARGRRLLLKEMSVAHKLNVLAHLERNSLYLADGRAHHLRFSMRQLEGEGLPLSDGVAGLYYRMSAEMTMAGVDTHGWVRQTPFYREALRQIADGVGGPDEREQQMHEDNEAAAEDATWG